MTGRPTVLKQVKQSILRNDFGTCQHIYDQEKKEIEQRICWPKPKINLNIPLASKYAKCVVLGRLMYWTPPPRSDHWTPLSKSYDLFREPRDIGPPFEKSWTRPC